MDLGSTRIQYDIMCGLNSVSQNTIFLALIKIKKKSYSYNYVSIPAPWSFNSGQIYELPIRVDGTSAL